MQQKLLTTHYVVLQLVIVISFLSFPSDGLVLTSPGGFVTYYVGDASSQVVISAPHGGKLKPASIANRPARGCYIAATDSCVYETGCSPVIVGKCKTNLVSDYRTDQLAEDIRMAFPVGQKPHVIVCEVHRKKLDANRDIPEATFGDLIATDVWNYYHDYIDTALQSVTGGGTRGLYIDLHGNGQPEMWNMVGMLISNTQLKNNNPLLESFAVSSSLENLHSSNSESMEDLVRGTNSIGGLLEVEGYPMVPSPSNLDAGNAKFFKGGFSTQRYTGGLVSGFQMEVYKTWRFTTSPREQFASDFTAAIQEWINLYY